jgi:hypothetical protein
MRPGDWLSHNTSADPLQTVPHKHSGPIITTIITTTIITLYLASTDDREHAIFDLLSLVYLTQHDEFSL